MKNLLLGLPMLLGAATGTCESTPVCAIPNNAAQCALPRNPSCGNGTCDRWQGMTCVDNQCVSCNTLKTNMEAGQVPYPAMAATLNALQNDCVVHNPASVIGRLGSGGGVNVPENISPFP